MVVPSVINNLLDDVYTDTPRVRKCTQHQITDDKTVYDVQFDEESDKENVCITICENGKNNKFRSEPLLIYQVFEQTDVPVPKVFQTGIHNGMDYYIAEYVDGVPVSDVFHQMTLSDQQTLLHYVGSVLGYLHTIDGFDEFGKITAVEPGELTTENDESTANDWHTYLYNETVELTESLPDEYDEYSLLIKNILVEFASGDNQYNNSIEKSICHTKCRHQCVRIHQSKGLQCIWDFEQAISGDKFYDLALTELLFIDLAVADQMKRSILRRALYQGYANTNEITPRYREYRSVYRLVGLLYYLSTETEPAPIPHMVDNVRDFYHEQIQLELEAIN